MTQQKRWWEEEFDEEFAYIFTPPGEQSYLYDTEEDEEKSKDSVRSFISKVEDKAREEERQFIYNVLNAHPVKNGKLGDLTPPETV